MSHKAWIVAMIENNHREQYDDTTYIFRQPAHYRLAFSKKDANRAAKYMSESNPGVDVHIFENIEGMFSPRSVSISKKWVDGTYIPV